MATKSTADKLRTPEELRALLDCAVKAPENCTQMADVREGIDAIDRLLGAFLAERQRYVERAGHIKPDRNQVRDTPRVEDVIAKASTAIAANGGNPDLGEAVWRPMIEWFINHEYGVYDAEHTAPRDTDDA